MKKYVILSLFLILVSVESYAQISDISFENSTYNYGLMPNNIQQNDIHDVYVDWRQQFVESCSNNRYRIRFDEPSHTVSEGIGYGMLLSVYANDKEVFDGLWLYYQSFLNSNGVMHWKVNGCTNNIEQNGATDAELDVAYALIVADKRWQSNGAINYNSDALSLIQIIKDKEVERGTFVLKPGDMWGGSINTNPSYLAPGYFRTFGIYSNDITYWNAVAAKSYEILNANLSQNNAVYNLVSDWCKSDGTYSDIVPWAFNQGQSYYYDAARTPWRIAVDYIWYGTDESIAYNQLCIDFVNAKGGFDEIYPGYHQNGTPIHTTFKDPTFTGAYSSAAMSSTNQTFVNSGYSELKSQVTTAYFGATLRALYMFALSGNMFDALKFNVLSTNDREEKQFKVFPNPVLNNLNISFTSSVEHSISLYSVTGQELLNKGKETSNDINLDLSNLESGVYFLKVNNKTIRILKN